MEKKLKIEEETAKNLYKEVPGWFQKVLSETFGEQCFKPKSFKDIKTYEDACKELNTIPNWNIYPADTQDEIAYKKLKTIAAAINGDWIPDWNNTNQKKWYPYFILSSGFGFSATDCLYVIASTAAGSRLCFESEEKAKYAGTQFKDLYGQFLK
jgi:hypothetical protein